MTSHSLLLETLAAAVLDGATVTFAPAEPADPGPPTAMAVGVHLDQRGRGHRNGVTVDLGDLSLADSADAVLAELINETLAPLIDMALREEITGELLLGSLRLRRQAHTSPA